MVRRLLLDCWIAWISESNEYISFHCTAGELLKKRFFYASQSLPYLFYAWKNTAVPFPIKQWYIMYIWSHNFPFSFKFYNRSLCWATTKTHIYCLCKRSKTNGSPSIPDYISPLLDSVLDRPLGKWSKQVLSFLLNVLLPLSNTLLEGKATLCDWTSWCKTWWSLSHLSL